MKSVYLPGNGYYLNHLCIPHVSLAAMMPNTFLSHNRNPPKVPSPVPARYNPKTSVVLSPNHSTKNPVLLSEIPWTVSTAQPVYQQE